MREFLFWLFVPMTIIAFFVIALYPLFSPDLELQLPRWGYRVRGCKPSSSKKPYLAALATLFHTLK